MCEQDQLRGAALEASSHPIVPPRPVKTSVLPLSAVKVPVAAGGCACASAPRAPTPSAAARVDVSRN